MDSSLTTLYADIRRHGSIPNTASTGSANSDLLAYINHNLTDIAAEVIRCREGFYRQYKDYTISSTQTRYRIPTRAIGNRLDCILLLDSNGKILRKLLETSYGASSNFRNLTDTMGYFLEAGDVVLTPTTPTGTAVTLRMVYYCRPPEVTSSLDTASGRCFTVSTVTDLGSNSYRLTITSSHGLTTSSSIDIMKGGAPFEYINACIGINPTATTSTTVTVTCANGTPEVGDYVCQADYAPVAQIPDAFWPVLAITVAKDFWMALGDEKMVARLDKELARIYKSAVALVSPRVEEGGQKIKSPYGALGALYGPARRVY